MIHAVSLGNQHLYARQLDQMFEARRGERKTDAFDNEHAVYLLNLDVFGDVSASVRLNPTTTLLRQLADHPGDSLPAGPSIWDLSLWTASAEADATSSDLMLGLLEFAQSRGLDRIIAFIDPALARMFAAHDWPVRPIQQTPARAVGAVEIEVGPHLLAFARASFGVTSPALVEIDTSRLGHGRQVDVPTGLRDAVADVGVIPLRRLVTALAEAIAGAHDKPRTIELVAAISRLIEAAGFSLNDDGSTASASNSTTR